VPAVEQAMPSDRRAVAYLHIVASDSVQLLYSCLDVVVVDVKDLECVEVDDQRLLVDGHSLGDVGHHVVDGWRKCRVIDMLLVLWEWWR
jgi:hypothetical protein